MPDTIALTGVVATTPRHVTTGDGLAITSFRLASSQRRYDRQQNTWVETGTNWYTVTAFRQLASNLAASVNKGDRVVAAGRLRIREWENSEKSGMTVEVEAESVGHDLAWGNSEFRRSVSSERQEAGGGWHGPGSAESPTSVAEHAAAEGFFPASGGESELLAHSPGLDSTRL
ncbi:single-stranded DNA-binding protein [Subtercola boreus]|uniref:Single-stranded DNA-binding protein n=1 Tax=Subtercola boreus TaxID=120213 RepID=A0A3E0WC56_9MICO|nr:single-stranded DNA-binding protein [Subtercola boreus]RFA22100.1 hypothetical protein B7R24_05305 [Subtercola boreus]RFA22280.1 hypothetical protein B7R23_05250 [Subtercola boreus]RFA28143.1 hypothetical protein B7R25_05375 [Subtercola boreus]